MSYNSRGRRVKLEKRMEVGSGCRGRVVMEKGDYGMGGRADLQKGERVEEGRGRMRALEVEGKKSLRGTMCAHEHTLDGES